MTETAVMTPSPPLPPELWNLAVIVTICALFGWLMRVVQLVLTFADLRYAVASNAVLYLKDLGASLHVLKRASMWHFQQLLRTNVEAASTKMKRVEIPFDLVSSSLEIKRVNAGATTPRADASNALSFRVRSSVPCSVQVLWSVRSESLDTSGSLSTGSSPASPTASILSPSQLIPPALRRISIDRTVRALRAAPASLSRIRRQRQRHELPDENVSHDDANELSPVASRGLCGSPAFEAGDAAASSELFRCETSSSETPQLFTVAVPSSAVQCPADELRSLIDEADSHSPSSPPPPRTSAIPSPHIVPSAQAARYSAVIVIRTLTSGSARANIFSKFGAGRDSKHDADSTVSAVCQCVALDFLPTPMKLERFSPVVVKKISYTKTAAYVSQDIYGRDVAASSECTICLEGVLSVVLLPCRHLCVCRVCLDEIDRCPICRSTFTTWVCYDVNSEEQEACGVEDEETEEKKAEEQGEQGSCSPAQGQLQAKMGS